LKSRYATTNTVFDLTSAILLTEITCSIFQFLSALDPLGALFQIFPFSAYISFANLTGILNFTTTYFMGKIFHKIVAAAFPEFEGKSKYVHDIAFFLFIVAIMILSILTSFAVSKGILVNIINAILILIFQLLLGGIFFKMKNTVIKKQEEMKKQLQANKKQKEDDGKMSNMARLLYISAFFMYAYCLFLILIAVGAVAQAAYLVWHAWMLTILTGTIVGICQVLAIEGRKKKTGLSTIKKSGNIGSAASGPEKVVSSVAMSDKAETDRDAE